MAATTMHTTSTTATVALADAGAITGATQQLFIVGPQGLIPAFIRPSVIEDQSSVPAKQPSAFVAKNSHANTGRSLIRVKGSTKFTSAETPITNQVPISHATILASDHNLTASPGQFVLNDRLQNLPTASRINVSGEPARVLSAKPVLQSLLTTKPAVATSKAMSVRLVSKPSVTGRLPNVINAPNSLPNNLGLKGTSQRSVILTDGKLPVQSGQVISNTIALSTTDSVLQNTPSNSQQYIKTVVKPASTGHGVIRPAAKIGNMASPRSIVIPLNSQGLRPASVVKPTFTLLTSQVSPLTSQHTVRSVTATTSTTRPASNAVQNPVSILSSGQSTSMIYLQPSVANARGNTSLTTGGLTRSTQAENFSTVVLSNRCPGKGLSHNDTLTCPVIMQTKKPQDATDSDVNHKPRKPSEMSKGPRKKKYRSHKAVLTKDLDVPMAVVQQARPDVVTHINGAQVTLVGSKFQVDLDNVCLKRKAGTDLWTDGRMPNVKLMRLESESKSVVDKKPESTDVDAQALTTSMKLGASDSSLVNIKATNELAPVDVGEPSDVSDTNKDWKDNARNDLSSEGFSQNVIDKNEKDFIDSSENGNDQTDGKENECVLKDSNEDQIKTELESEAGDAKERIVQKDITGSFNSKVSCRKLNRILGNVFYKRTKIASCDDLQDNKLIHSDSTLPDTRLDKTLVMYIGSSDNHLRMIRRQLTDGIDLKNSIYQCLRCKETFYTRQGGQLHIHNGTCDLKKRKAAVYVCKECHYAFCSKEEINKHHEDDDCQLKQKRTKLLNQTYFTVEHCEDDPVEHSDDESSELQEVDFFKVSKFHVTDVPKVQNARHVLKELTLVGDDRSYTCYMCLGCSFKCIQKKRSCNYDVCKNEFEVDSDVVYGCKKCEKTFFKKEALVEHYSILGLGILCKGIKGHATGHTSVSKSNQNIVERPRSKRVSQEDHVCRICGLKFTAKINFTIHFNQHVRQGWQECKFCDSYFKVEHLRNHMMRVHSDEYEGMSNRRCKDPDKNKKGKTENIGKNKRGKSKVGRSIKEDFKKGIGKTKHQQQTSDKNKARKLIHEIPNIMPKKGTKDSGTTVQQKPDVKWIYQIKDIELKDLIAMAQPKQQQATPAATCKISKSLWSCGYCQEKFDGKEMLVYHLSYHNDVQNKQDSQVKPGIDYRYICSYCSCPYINFEAFLQHLYTHNEQKVVVTCEECGHEANGNDMINEHWQSHSRQTTTVIFQPQQQPDVRGFKYRNDNPKDVAVGNYAHRSASDIIKELSLKAKASLQSKKRNSITETRRQNESFTISAKAEDISSKVPVEMTKVHKDTVVETILGPSKNIVVETIPDPSHDTIIETISNPTDGTVVKADNLGTLDSVPLTVSVEAINTASPINTFTTSAQSIETVSTAQVVYKSTENPMVIDPELLEQINSNSIAIEQGQVDSSATDCITLPTFITSTTSGLVEQEPPDVSLTAIPSEITDSGMTEEYDIVNLALGTEGIVEVERVEDEQEVMTEKARVNETKDSDIMKSSMVEVCVPVGNGQMTSSMVYVTMPTSDADAPDYFITENN